MLRKTGASLPNILLFRPSMATLVGDGYVIDKTTIPAGSAGLIVTNVDAIDGLAGKSAQIDSDIVPLIQLKMSALMCRMHLVAILIFHAGITQVGAIGKDHVNGDTRAICARGQVGLRFGTIWALRINPIREPRTGIKRDNRRTQAEGVHICVGCSSTVCCTGIEQRVCTAMRLSVRANKQLGAGESAADATDIADA